MSEENILSEIRAEIRRNTAILEDIVLQLAELKNENANFRNELNNNQNKQTNRQTNNGSKLLSERSLDRGPNQGTTMPKRGSNPPRARSPRQNKNNSSVGGGIGSTDSPGSKLSQRKKQLSVATKDQDARSASMPVPNQQTAGNSGFSLAAAAAGNSSVHFFSNNNTRQNGSPAPSQHRKFSGPTISGNSTPTPDEGSSGSSSTSTLQENGNNVGDDDYVHMKFHSQSSQQPHQEHDNDRLLDQQKPLPTLPSSHPHHHPGKHITFSSSPPTESASSWTTSSVWNDKNEQQLLNDTKDDHSKPTSPLHTSHHNSIFSSDGRRWVRLFSPIKKNYFLINIDSLEQPKRPKSHVKVYANPIPTTMTSFGGPSPSVATTTVDHSHHRIVWESADVGHHWESFFIADVGENLYVNTVTGEATFTRPEATIPKRSLRRRSSFQNNSTPPSSDSSLLSPGTPNDATNGETSRSKTEQELNREDDDKKPNETSEEDYEFKQANEKVDFDVSAVANLRSPKTDENQQSKKITAIRQKNVHGFRLGMSGSRVKRASNRWMFSPEGTRKLVWDFVIVFPMLVYLAIMTPFFMCFAWDPRRERNPNLVVFEAIIDIVFIMDICFNFRTGFINSDGDAEYDSMAVIKNYCAGWFPVDLVSAVPYGLLRMTLGVNEQENSWFGSVKILKLGRSARALRLFRFLKISRLLKNLKIMKTMDRETIEKIQDFVSHYGGRQNIMYLQVGVTLSLLCHLLGCFWVYVGRQQDKFGNSNWLRDGSYTAFTYKDTKGGSKVGSIYLAAFYFCMTTMTSVGYGDISPLNDTERAFTIALEAVGCVMYALIVAVLTSAIMSSDANARAIATRLEAVTSYIKARGFSPVLARKLRLYFRHFYSEKMAIDEQEILKDLSTSLRMEVSTFLVSELMGQVSLFRLLSPVHWSMVLPLLRPCRFTALDYICQQGEDCTDLFVVLSGTCQSRSLPLADKPSPPPTAQDTQEGTPKKKSKKKSKKEKSEEKHDSDEVKEDVSHQQASKRGSHSIIGTTITKVISGATENPTLVNGEDWVVKRSIGAGDTINALCLVGVWTKSIETVKCDDVVEAYGINCDEFRACFGDDALLWKKLQRHVTYTMHEMIPDPDAPTEYGMPLHVLDGEEIAEREYELELEERSEMSRRKDQKQKQLTESIERNNMSNFELGYSI
jgi:hypothetical protein